MEPFQLICAHEGLRLRVYDDATREEIGPGSTLKGYPTIGYGRCLSRTGLSYAEASYLLANDMAACENDLQLIFGDRWASFAEPRQAALVDMRYELGASGFRDFHQMITAIMNGAWGNAADAALDSEWARQVPTRAAQDAEILRTGKFPD